MHLPKAVGGRSHEGQPDQYADDNEPGEVASLVVVSTLLSVATTPIVLAILAP